MSRLFCITLFLLLWLEAAADDKIPQLFNIPAAPMAETLIVFAQQTELSILVDASTIKDFMSPALSGVMTAAEGLQYLLAGTGLGYQYISPRTVAISTDFYRPPEIIGLSADGDKQDETITIENIIVTALRQRENLQQTPAAISVLERQTLSYDTIKTLDEVSSRVPGLTVSSFSLGQPTIHIRGIGSNDDGAAMDNSVVVFMDDVYIGRITGINLRMFDMEQVEVLRGPQGVLYGKNVIGGAIKLTSNIPVNEPQLQLKLSTGNYHQQGINLLLNGPLTDESLLGRVAVQGTRREGWQENIILGGDKQHAVDEWGFRSQLSYALSDELEVLWSIDYSQDNLNSSGRIPVRGGTPLRLQDGGITDAGGDPLTRLPTDIFADLGGDPEHATNSIEGFTDRTMMGFNQRLSHQYDNVQFIAISAWRDTQFKWLEDSTGLPTSATSQTVAVLDDESHSQFSQELRWSTDSDSRMSYVAGLYYLYEHTRRIESFPFQGATGSSDQDNRTESFAAFGQINYFVLPVLKVSLGGRYTYDQKRLRQTAINGGAPAIILEDFELSSSASWEDFLPQMKLSLSAAKDLLLYTSISRGLKSGGFQGVPGTATLAATEILPEYAWNYEAGVKSTWLDNRLRLNIAGFYTDYRDLQVVQFQTIDNFGLFQTTNAASATVKGAEVEVMAQVTNYLSVSGSYAYLSATYDSFNDLQGRDFSGSKLRQAPEDTLSIGFQYKRPLAAGSLRLRADYRYQSESFREPDNTIARLPAHRLIDANLSFLAPDKQWELSLWAKNLLDERYISHLYVLGGNDYALYGTPRQYGLSLSWHFI